MAKKPTNKDKVLDLIKEKGPISNTILSNDLEIDLANLGRIIKQLLQDGIILQSIEKKGQTRERINTFNPEGKKSTQTPIKKEKKIPEIQEEKPKKIIIPKIEKPKRELTEHLDKKFITDKDSNKQELISKIFEITNVHEKEIPADFLRSKLLEFDLVAHRKLIQEKEKELI